MPQGIVAMDDGEALRTDLVRIDDTCLVLSDHFQITPTGLRVVGKPTLEHAAKLGSTLNLLDQALQLSLGGFMNFAESSFGEASGQVLDAEEGWADAKRTHAAWVDKRVPPENRMIPPLFFAHLETVAALPPTEQRKWLMKALNTEGDGQWSVAKLRAEIAKATEEGRSKLRWWLVVKADSEAKAEALTKKLESEGYAVVMHSGVKKERKPRAKKKEVTAKKRRRTKISASRRQK